MTARGLCGRQRLALLSLGVFCATCGDDGSTVEPALHYVRQDSAGLILHVNGYWDGVPVASAGKVTLDVGAGAEDVGTPLSNVAGAVALEGELAVADNGSRSILIFDDDGRFVRSFGGEGEGPGEFKNLGGIWRLDSERLAVFDRRLQRTTVYSEEGQLESVSAIQPARPNPPLPVDVMAAGELVFQEVEFDPPENGFERLRAAIRLFSADSVATILDTLTGRMGRMQVSGGSFLGAPHFEAGLQVSAAAGAIWVSDCRKPEVRQFDGSGRLRSIVRWRTRGREVTPDAVEALRREGLGNLVGRERKRAGERFDVHPVAPEFPACDGLLASDSGHLYVRRFSRPGERQVRWLSFRNGQLGRTILLPQGADLLGIYEGHVLTLERDELDVEHVRVRGIANQ